MPPQKFEFWRKCLMLLSGLFALQGLSWIVMGSFDPFGLYEGYMARSFWGLQQAPPAAKKTFSFLLGPFGATDAGFFVLMFFLVRFPFAKRERWSYQAVVAGVLCWFVPDMLASLWHKAYFNIWIVNIPAIVSLGVPLWALRKGFVEPQTPFEEPSSR